MDWIYQFHGGTAEHALKAVFDMKDQFNDGLFRFVHPDFLYEPSTHIQQYEVQDYLAKCKHAKVIPGSTFVFPECTIEQRADLLSCDEQQQRIHSLTLASSGARPERLDITLNRRYLRHMDAILNQEGYVLKGMNVLFFKGRLLWDNLTREKHPLTLLPMDIQPGPSAFARDLGEVIGIEPTPAPEELQTELSEHFGLLASTMSEQ